MKYRWSIAPIQSDLIRLLTAELKISPVLAQCLVHRGICDLPSAEAFLRPRLKNLQDPFLLPNMAEAVQRLLAARERGESIVIFGDYDVDGVSRRQFHRPALGGVA
jgi:single-stranded-DNA-specific exonuclease